jgi:hypothetical protein
VKGVCHNAAAMVRLPRITLVALLTASLLSVARGLDIQLHPDAGLASNSAALAAFERAAASWEKIFDDPITVVINAGLTPLGPNIIGSTTSVLLFGDNFAEIRDAMVLDDALEGGSIVQSLPTFAQLSATLPPGRTLFDSMVVTQANLKALGFTGLEAISGHNEDATISFSSNFSFDFDNTNGVDFFKVDFETAAAHEIAHALGFDSIVDVIDSTTTADFPEVLLYPLDLFRFGSGVGKDPSNALQFTTFPRELVPGNPAHFDDTLVFYAMATGLSGDGNQASHWKDDALTGQFIGIMDPTLNFGTGYNPTAADARALDLIGYHVAPIPEPVFSGLFLVVVIGCSRRKPQR